MAEFKIECLYCGDASVLMRAASAPGQDEFAWRKRWKESTVAGLNGRSQLQNIACPVCGGQFDLVDDGVPVESGGIVARKNVSRPRLYTTSSSGGSRLGGQNITLTGHGLDAGNLKIYFGGKEVLAYTNRYPNQVEVVSPPARYTMQTADTPWWRLVLSNITGTFSLDEAYTTSAAATGVIREISGSVLRATSAGVPVGVGQIITGSSSGATATISEVTQINFLPGEMVKGSASNAMGVVVSAYPLVVDNPTAGFAAGEILRGQSSDACVELASPSAYSGVVDISAENEYGQRVGGESVLAGFYTYE